MSKKRVYIQKRGSRGTFWLTNEVRRTGKHQGVIVTEKFLECDGDTYLAAEEMGGMSNHTVQHWMGRAFGDWLMSVSKAEATAFISKLAELYKVE